MTKETRQIIAEGLMDKFDVPRLLDEKEKTNDSVIERMIDDELEERQTCPECGNDMMWDDDNNMYCPLGHGEII